MKFSLFCSYKNPSQDYELVRRIRNYYSFSEKKLVVLKVKNYDYLQGVGGVLVRVHINVKNVKGRLQYGDG